MSYPHRCPICEGRGAVPCNFYTGGRVSTDASDVPCKACSGTGILWGPVEDKGDEGR